MSDQNTSHFFPLETLLLRLEREGFTFGIDQHLRLQKVLKELGKDYLKEPEKLRNILAPILVFTQDGTRTFDRVFDEYIQLVVKPSVNQRLFNIEDPHLQDGHIQVDPRVRWLTSISRWILSWVGVVVLLLSVGIFLLLPNIQAFLGWTEDSFIPTFSILKVGQNDPLGLEDSIFVGENIVFRNTSLLGSGARVRKNENNDSGNAYEISWKIENGESLMRQEPQTEENNGFQHTFRQEGTYRVSLLYVDKEDKSTHQAHRSVQVFCREAEKPKVSELKILPDPASKLPLIVNEQVNFSMGIPEKWGEYKVEWFLDGEKLQQPAHIFQDSGAYIIRAEASLLDDPNNYCKAIEKTFILTLVHNYEKDEILLEPVSMSLDPAGETKYGFSLWARFLPILLAFGLVFLVDRIRLRRKRRKLLQTYKLERESISEGPVEIPFPELDHLISHDPKVFSLANAMRQRSLGDRQKFDIKTTIRDTARSLGLVNLRFLQTSKASEYVIFIEQIHPQSHTARLFSRLVQMLKGEDVVLEVFYFDRDMRICWNEDFAEGIRIEQIQQKYRGHRLLIYSDGENLIDPYEAKIKDWVKTQLSVWKGKSAIITPKLVADWGYKEKCLSEYFYLLSAELGAQQLLPELFTNEEIEGYESYLKLSEEYAPNPQESLRDYDFNQLEDLRLFLGDSHFELLAACMVYPLPSWEVSLSMAKTLSIRTGNEYLQTYDTFLRLGRIPWMQTGLVSPGLRRQLLSTLRPETEHLARKTILELLDQVGVKKDSLAGRKLAIQQISNKFLTEPGDAEIARQMYVLWRKNEILDPVVEERLHKKSAQLRGESSDRYLKTRFEVITPMRTLLKALLLGFLVAIGTYKLDQVYSGNPSLKEFSYRFGLDGILTVKQEALDEASYFNNQGVKAFRRGDMLKARKDFYRAMQQRHYDILASSDKEDVPKSWQEAAKRPNWPVLLEVEGKEQRMDFGINIDERLINLDSIKSIEDFDDALLSSFDRSRIFISSDTYVKRFKFVNYPLFNGKEGLLPAYLFNYYYPTAGKNLISLISYNKGVEAFNQRKFYEAKDAFNLSFSLMGAGLVRASPYTHMDLFVASADAFIQSKFHTGDTTGAIALNKILQSIDPKYFVDEKAPSIKFAEYLADEGLMINFSGYKKEGRRISSAEIAEWEEMPGALQIEYKGEIINLAAPLNIAAAKITQDSLRYLGTDTLADPAGIVHRMFSSMKKENFSDLKFPDHVEDRESWEIADWFCKEGLLTMMNKGANVDEYIKVGTILFYGGRGVDFRDSSSQKLFHRGGINHVGVVCSVERDEEGGLISYGVFHAQRPGLIAKITQERMGEYSAEKEYMAYSYQNNQLLAVAPILPVKDSIFTQNISKNCLDDE